MSHGLPTYFCRMRCACIRLSQPSRLRGYATRCHFHRLCIQETTPCIASCCLNCSQTWLCVSIAAEASLFISIPSTCCQALIEGHPPVSNGRGSANQKGRCALSASLPVAIPICRRFMDTFTADAATPGRKRAKEGVRFVSASGTSIFTVLLAFHSWMVTAYTHSICAEPVAPNLLRAFSLQRMSVDSV